MPRPTNPPDPIITTLRTTRQHRGIDQATIAHATGVDRTSVTGWENGRVQPPLPRLRAWATALGYDLRLVPSPPFAESFTAGAGHLVAELAPGTGQGGKPCTPIPCPPLQGGTP